MKFRNYDKYEVYDDGRIWSYKSKKFLKPFTNQYGYQQVCLFDNEGKRKWYLVHRIVWEAVTGEQIPQGMQINHRSEVKTENMISNLELMTPKQNINYGSGIERCHKAQINGKRSKQVGAFKNGELVMKFPSTMEAGRQGFNNGNIVSCCNGKLKKYKGFEWKYI